MLYDGMSREPATRQTNLSLKIHLSSVEGFTGGCRAGQRLKSKMQNLKCKIQNLTRKVYKTKETKIPNGHRNRGARTMPSQASCNTEYPTWCSSLSIRKNQKSPSHSTNYNTCHKQRPSIRHQTKKRKHPIIIQSLSPRRSSPSPDRKKPVKIDA